MRKITVVVLVSALMLCGCNFSPSESVGEPSAPTIAVGPNASGEAPETNEICPAVTPTVTTPTPSPTLEPTPTPTQVVNWVTPVCTPSPTHTSTPIPTVTPVLITPAPSSDQSPTPIPEGVLYDGKLLSDVVDYVSRENPTDENMWRFNKENGGIGSENNYFVLSRFFVTNFDGTILDYTEVIRNAEKGENIIIPVYDSTEDFTIEGYIVSCEDEANKNLEFEMLDVYLNPCHHDRFEDGPYASPKYSSWRDVVERCETTDKFGKKMVIQAVNRLNSFKYVFESGRYDTVPVFGIHMGRITIDGQRIDPLFVWGSPDINIIFRKE